MKACLIPICLSVALTVNAQVEEPDTATVLSEVTILGKNTNTLPGSGAIIEARKLSQFNQPDINKVLRTVPGVNVRDEEGFGLRPNIGLRGTQVNRSAKITLMEDGVLMAPAPYADPSAYYFPTFARMESVEVLKGSSQIKYGPYTIGGALNLISTSIPNAFRGFAQFSYGSFGTNQQRIWMGDSHKNFDYVFEVNRIASNGFKELDNKGNTGFDRRDVMGKMRWHTDVSAKVQQSLTMKFVNMTEQGNESYLGLTFDDFKANPNRRYSATQKDILDMKHHNVSLTHSISPVKGFSIVTTGYYASTFRDWARVNTIAGKSINAILADPVANDTAYQVMTGNANGTVAYQSAARTYTVKGIQTNLKYELLTGSVKHTIQAGVRYHEDQADRYATRSTYNMLNGTMILITPGVTGNNENQIRGAKSVASYFQYDFNFKKLTVSPGIRHEQITFDIMNYGTSDNARLGTALKTASNQLSILLPGIGINYAIKNYMSVFGGAHKGFSPPGMPSTTTSEQAKVETAMNYELGYRYNKNGLKTQLVGFYNDYDNILGSDNVSGGGAGTGDMYNAGNATIMGAEISIEYNILSRLNKENNIRMPLGIAYTFTDAKFDETFINAGGDWGTGTINQGDYIPFITPHLFTATLGVETNKFNATLISRYVGDTRTIPGQGELIRPGENVKYSEVNTIAGYWVFDLSANYRFYQGVSAYLSANNLLNTKYIVANLPQGYRPGMPFALNVGLKANF